LTEDEPNYEFSLTVGIYAEDHSLALDRLDAVVEAVNDIDGVEYWAGSLTPSQVDPAPPSHGEET
jgi:hypothetical protein